MNNYRYRWCCWLLVALPSLGWAMPTKPTIEKVLYGELGGQKIYQYTLQNNQGMQVKVINYGATITDIITPDRTGRMGSVVLGFDSLSGYTGRGNALMGAVVGRVANRIANRQFVLDNKTYTLTSNIHGGARGFDRRVWNIEEMRTKRQVALKLTYSSKDGEEGFPGNLQVTMLYILTNKNELILQYQATTDQATPVVLTNHTYFNLSGGEAPQVLNTELTVLADSFLVVNREQMPTGKVLPVQGTPFDFTQPVPIGQRINEKEEQLSIGRGYDQVFALRNQTGRLALAATAYEPISGRVLQAYTTEPGLVFYTGNHLSERVTGRNGKPFTKNGAFCLESQHYPDSPNQPAFPNTILRPGDIFRSQTVYRFSVRH